MSYLASSQNCISEVLNMLNYVWLSRQSNIREVASLTEVVILTILHCDALLTL